MGETKENKKTKKGKHKAKATIGDIIFRVLIIVVIFFIAIISYSFYLRTMLNPISEKNNVTKNTTYLINQSK